MWAMFCHLAALAGYVAPLVGNIVGPLVVWLIKKDQYPAVDAHGKESLNFQISLTIYLLVSIAIAVATCGFLFPLPIGVAIAGIVLSIVAAVKANQGEFYRYPLTIRMIT